jgi:hypothetical protein
LVLKNSLLSQAAKIWGIENILRSEKIVYNAS